MHIDLEIECYKNPDGQKMVFLSHNGSSGCKYPYEDNRELKAIVSNYIKDAIDYEYINNCVRESSNKTT